MTTNKTETGARASAAVGGGDPVAGLDPSEMAEGLRDLFAPQALARESIRTLGELTKIALGTSDIAPKPKDKRFADPTWKDNPFYRRLGQSYLAWVDSVERLVDQGPADDYRRFRARSVARLLTDSLAPTNFLLGNPTAVKRAYDTGGVSVVKGARNFVNDAVNNGGLPSQVDSRPFKVGQNLAATPGAVVHREPMFELIHYAPTTERVRERPLLMIPPQVNKYYFLDLAPGKSFVEYLVGQGIDFYLVAWRNPRQEHGSWGLEDYVAAQLRALDVVQEISGSDDVNLFGACAGGMTSGVMLGHLAARGERKVNAATWAISMLDTRQTNVLKLLGTQRLLRGLKKDAEQRKVYDAREVSQNFAWMRPNDLIFNYVVNNWLMGEDPPAFDILAWNNDASNLTARFDSDMLDIYSQNKLGQPGAVTVLGTPIDLRKVDCDTFVIAGMTDHITPWKPCYMTTQVLSGDAEVVITSTGHIQTVVNPPGKPRARYWHGPATSADPEEWLAQAQEHSDSWWPRYAEWLVARSGEERPAPQSLGSEAHPVLDPAPGRYVFER